MNIQLIVHLFGGTKLAMPTETRNQLVAALSHCCYWDEEQSRWVGDMAVFNVEEFDDSK